MNENNLEFLKNTLERLDFPVEVGNKLAKEVEAQKPEIKLEHEVNRNNETVKFDLNFRKSDTTDMYFFNSYQATLKTGNEAHDKTQEFRIRNGNNMGMDDAFNLVAGRAVHKSMVNGDGDAYQAWLKVDFSQKDNYGNHKMEQFSDRYGYNLDKALGKFPITALKTEVPEAKESLIGSLKAGNSTAVTMTKDGQEVSYFIEANPRLRTINIKDEKGISVRRDQLEIKDQSKSAKIAESNDQGQKSNKKQGLSV